MCATLGIGTGHPGQEYARTTLPRLEIKHLTIELNYIYLRVAECNSVLCFLYSVLIVEAIYQSFVVTTLSGKVIQILIIVDPQSNIPRLVVAPAVVRNVKMVGLVGGSHLLCFVCPLTLLPLGPLAREIGPVVTLVHTALGGGTPVLPTPPRPRSTLQ